MRKARLAAAVAFGAWVGWRAARSGMADRLAGPARPGRAGTAGTAADELVEAVRSRELPMALEKLMALVELGGERGLELVQGVVGRRTGHAA